MKDQWWEGQSRFGIRPGLERIRELLARLGHPEEAYPIIHVAGTNGKGSVAAMVTEALRSQGLSVGLNTSPDLGHINERIMIDRVPLDEALWDSLGEEVEEAGRTMADVPTFFEAVTALAFLAFQRLRVDVAVVEVGLGGRLDATNAIPRPMLAIITPIALDHMDRLGPDVESIAAEKAGIIKPGTELVLARQPFDAARRVVFERARRLGVPVFEPTVRATVTPGGPTLRIPGGRAITIPLKGVYQASNLDTAWTAITRLQNQGWIPRIEDAARALEAVQWPGRFQVVSDEPLIVVDGAHNPHGIEGVVATLSSPPWNSYRWHLLFGVLADKPGSDMLERLLPHVSDIVLTRVPGERGSDPTALLPSAQAEHHAEAVESLKDAVKAAKARLTGPRDALLVAGSLALLMHLQQEGLFQYAPQLGVDM